jgi:serine/threonine protein kinase
MSPEQAEMTSLDIDTRSDIYSLGVLLYELLTSRTPFDPKELMAAGLDAIRENEPPRPSTRLSTMLAADLTNVSSKPRAWNAKRWRCGAGWWVSRISPSRDRSKILRS